MINLSKRLQTVASMVTKGHVLLDVGCDHGYIPITLIQTKTVPYAVASDVRKGPLSRAEEHVKEAGLTDCIRLQCADGIPKRFPSLFEEMEGGAAYPVTCVIAGMGGMLMAGILADAGALLDQIDEFVLSPQSDLAYFRKQLFLMGLVIREEAFLEEDGKYYTVMRCVHRTAEDGEGLLPCDTELMFGALLLKEQHPILRQYLLKRKRVLDSIRKQLLLHGYGVHDDRMIELEREERKVCDALGRYE